MKMQKSWKKIASLLLAMIMAIQLLPLVAFATEDLPKYETVTDVTVTDETVTDETVTDETVVDETVVDETVVDETVVDETVTDETVVDETVTDETVTDENKEHPEESPSDEGTQNPSDEGTQALPDENATVMESVVKTLVEQPELTIEYAEVDQTKGKLWIDGIGDRVFDTISYTKTTTGERADQVSLDPETGMLTAAEGYTLATQGNAKQAVSFQVEAAYYNAADVLFVENFEGAQKGDKGTSNGGGQAFHGVYGPNAAPAEVKGTTYELPVVMDITKARAGSKVITQGPVDGQGATRTQAETIKASLTAQALETVATDGALATMWYYDDGSAITAGQSAFMGGVVTKTWEKGAFPGAMGVANNGTASKLYTEYLYRHTSGTWDSTGVARTAGWHKFQWKIGPSNTEMYIDDVKLASTSNVKQSDFGGFNLVFNWNNQNVPVNNKHFMDSFCVVKTDAVASNNLDQTFTVYVVSEDDVPKLTYTQAQDNKSATIAVTNLTELGATLDTCTITPQTSIEGKLTLDATTTPGTGAVAVVEGTLLSHKDNPLATAVVVDVAATYHFDGGGVGDESFEDTVTLYYDIDESAVKPDELTGTGEREIVELSGEGWKFGGKGEADAFDAGFDDSAWADISVPHDWNARTGYDGRGRENGTFWYRKTLTLTQEEADRYNTRSAYLEFDAVGMEAHVYLNGEEIGSHKGGWSAFKLDITGKLVAGENLIAVSANNERKLNGDISPLHGDFDNASGINRDVRLVLTSQVHLDQVDNGSHGVYMIPRQTDSWNGASDKTWEVDVTARIANDTAFSRDVTVVTTVSHPKSFNEVLGLEEKGLLLFDPADMYDSNGTVVGTQTVTGSAQRSSATDIKLTVPVTDPKLWNGTTSPYQYVAKVEVYEGGDTTGALLDSYETMIGFRYYDAVRTDASGYGTTQGDGFTLNGQPYLLRGMAIHKDWPGLGRALSEKYIEKDIALLYEMGATWTRVSHYPHDEYTYELLSRYGIACSAEIPLVDGVSMVNQDGSYTTSKTSGKLSPTFKETTLNQFDDMVKQNYNQAAILGWLMQNELGGGTYGQGSGADATAAQAEMITALNDRSHALDSGRATVMAMSISNCYKFESDWLLWNGYPGWYGSELTGIGHFIDGQANSTDPQRVRPTGASEYGAGVNPWHQTDYTQGDVGSDGKPTFNAWNGSGKAFHPESYGNDRNEQSLREILARPFYWATGGWIMFDFSASSRNEGGRKGVNDKGLVYKARPEEVDGYNIATGDPEDLLLRKDGFYLYKANLHPDPMTYITERRYEMREKQEIKVTVYSNAPVVELFQNGVSLGKMTATELAAYVNRQSIADETASCIFKFSATLAEGGNTFLAKGFEADGTTPHSQDTVVWQYGNPPQLDIASTAFVINNSTKTIMLTGSGTAENVNTLFAPTMDVEHTYQVLTADRQPVTSGPMRAGMLLEVTWGAAKRVYTFQQPYISALKEVKLDGVASADTAKAVDFQENTLWEAADGQAHSLTIDLGKKYVLTELKINWANGEAAASQYTVHTSNDGATWIPVVDRSANTVANGVVQNALQSYGRYVRVEIAAGTAPKISELEVHGWMVSLKGGEKRVFVDESERTISLRTDIPDFHQGEVITAGLVFDKVEPLLIVEGNAGAVHENYDYSLDLNTSRYVVTDTLGRKIPFKFQGFTGTAKPAGPFELAMGKPTTASSVQNSTFPAINATTENDDRWNGFSQGKQGLDEWVLVDLGAECTLSSMRLEFPRYGVGGITSNRYYLFEVHLGNSPDSLEKVIDKNDHTDTGGIFEFTTEVTGKTARYVKVKVTGNSMGYQPGLNRIYVKGTSGAVTTYTASLSVNLDGVAYAAHGKTFTLRQDGQTYAAGTGTDGTVSFTGLVNGLYDIYEGEDKTGATMSINGANGTATLNYYTVTADIMEHGTVTANATTAAAGSTVTLTVTPEEDYWLVENSLKVFQTGDDTVLVDVTQSNAFTMPDYPVTITAEFGAGTAVTGVTLDKERVKLYSNRGDQTVQLTATIAPEEASNTAVTWTSDNEAVATVDENGLVTAVGKGTAIITVTTEEGGFTATCTLRVTTYSSSSFFDSSSSSTTATEKNEDGSTSKIVTDTKSGDVTETITYPDGTKLVATTPKGGQKTIQVTVPSHKDKVTVTIPTDKRPAPGEVAVMVKPDGTREIIKTCVASEEGLRLTLTQGGKLEIVDNSKEFSDVTSESWAFGSVQFATSRELFQGTGEDRFAPAEQMTRSMLITVLARLDGQDTDGGESWYSKAIDWGMENGITDGTNVNASISRESLVVMLYRYAKAEGADGMALEEFPDTENVSDWAGEAMSWAVAKGILEGADGKLNPGDTASRAEVATMLQRFISL